MIQEYQGYLQINIVFLVGAIGLAITLILLFFWFKSLKKLPVKEETKVAFIDKYGEDYYQELIAARQAALKGEISTAELKAIIDKHPEIIK